jgi:carbonic anhydrase
VRQISRARLITSVAVLVAAPIALLHAGAAAPAESLARLKAGNAAFVADPSAALPVDAEKRTALAKGQTPFATVLSCSDSRVPPELVFHTGLGDLFVVRAAGHVPDRSVLASVEYAAEHLNVPLVVVMGHEMCGAVRATVETPRGQSLGPNLDYLIKAIRPAVARAASQPERLRLRAAIMENVEETINGLLGASTILKHMAEEKRVGLVGGYYELATGRVHFSALVDLPPGTSSATASATPPSMTTH